MKVDTFCLKLFFSVLLNHNNELCLLHNKVDDIRKFNRSKTILDIVSVFHTNDHSVSANISTIPNRIENVYLPY